MGKAKIKSGTTLKIPPLKGIVAFNLVTLVIAIGIFLGYTLRFDDGISFNFQLIPFIIIMIFWLIFLIVTIIYFTRYHYYITKPDGIHYYKFNKKKTYSYDNILFIDQTWSVKHKKINMLMKDGVEVFLPFDRDGVIYDLIMTNSRFLIGDFEAKNRFPSFKISLTSEEKIILKEEQKREKKLEKEARRNQKKNRK